MDMKEYKKIINNLGTLLIVTMIMISACSKGHQNRLTNADDAAPGKITNVRVKNFGGGAVIYYDLPNSKDLLYVKAVWETKSAGVRTTKQTFYEDSLRVDGFLSTDPHKVHLYSYSRGGSRSDSVTVTVHPLIPPVKSVYQSIVMKPAFGGVSLSFQNPDTADVVITLMKKDSLGRFAAFQRHYTSAREDTFYVRGLKSNPQKFGYYVRDQYQNRSDTTSSVLTPIYETLLDKTKFSNARFPTDSWHPRFGSFNLMWNNKTAGTVPNTYWQSKFQPSFPFWITIDLGQKAKIDRIVIWGWPTHSQFARKFPKKYEYWGSLNPKTDKQNPFNSSWFKYGTFLSNPPSGQRDDPTETDKGDEYPVGGDQQVIQGANSFPPTRYLRIKFLDSWGGEPDIMIGEIDIYGSPVGNSN
jgi:hypothetical protein